MITYFDKFAGSFKHTTDKSLEKKTTKKCVKEYNDKFMSIFFTVLVKVMLLS